MALQQSALRRAANSLRNNTLNHQHQLDNFSGGIQPVAREIEAAMGGTIDEYVRGALTTATENWGREYVSLNDIVDRHVREVDRRQARVYPGPDAHETNDSRHWTNANKAYAVAMLMSDRGWFKWQRGPDAFKQLINDLWIEYGG